MDAPISLSSSTIRSNLPSPYSQNLMTRLLTDASWDNVELYDVFQLFFQNLRWINSQTGNEKRDIQGKLFTISDRISKNFEGPEAERLTSQIQATAIGLSSDKLECWNTLPEKIQHHIFADMIEKYDSPRKILRYAVSQTMRESAFNFISKHIPLSLVSKHIPLSLVELGCKTVEEGIEYVKNNDLKRVDFTGFSRFSPVTDKVLENLVINCPNITSLTLRSLHVTEEKLCEVLKLFVNLKSLSLVSFFQMRKLNELVKSLVNIQDLSFTNNMFIPKEEFLVLKQLVNLESLNLAGSTQITGKEIIEILKPLTNLKSLNLDKCKIECEELSEAFKPLTNLQSLSLSGCQGIDVNELSKLLKVLVNLESLNLTKSNIETSTLVEMFPDLEIIR